MRRILLVLCLLAGCAQTPPAEPIAALPPVQQAQVVVVEKPAPPPKVIVREVEKRVVVEKPVIVERPVVVERRVEVPAAAPPAPPQPRSAAQPIAMPKPAPAPAPAPAGKLVIVVIDGDTVDVNGARWRLDGYDAPETGDRAQCAEEREKGEKAKRRLQQILGAAKVETQTLGHRDRYGRIIGTIRADGRDVGELLAKEGLAKKATFQVLPWCGKPEPAVPPLATSTKRPVKVAAACKGLPKASCAAARGCRWVDHAAATDKNGRPLTDYCRTAGRAS